MKTASEYSKERREKFRENGLCISCGKVPPVINKVKCSECSEYARKSNELWRRKNPDKVKSNRRDWYSGGKFSHITRILQKKRRLQLRKKVIEKYGGKCACCSESTYEFLQIDHIDKNGKQHRLEIGRGMKLHRDMLKNDTRYRVRILCGNCHNAITAHGVCPHEISKNFTCSLVAGAGQ